MIQPGKEVSDDDDLALELPAPDGELEAESESGLPDDDADLGLDAEERSVGLDLDTGLEDAVPDEPAVEDEGTSWILESEPGDFDELDPADSVRAEDENGWTEGSEPAAETADEELEAETGLTGGPSEDAGDEGLGDEAGLELEDLPPLDLSSVVEEEEETLDSATLDPELAALAVPDAGEELAPWVFAARLGIASVQLDLLARTAQPLGPLAAAADYGLAWDGRQLLVALDLKSSPEGRARGLGTVSMLAALPAATGLLVAASCPEGVRVSRDGGQSFGAPLRVSVRGSAPALIAFGLGPSGPRLWAASPMGGLFASDDLGAGFSPIRPDWQVLRLVSDGMRGLLVLCRSSDGSGAAWLSTDAGSSFTSLALPSREPERVLGLQLCDGTVLCAQRGATPALGHARAATGTWLALPDYATAPARLLSERGELAAYFLVERGGKTLLVRELLSDRSAKPVLIAELPSDAGAVLAIEGVSRGNTTTLQLATERGWYRVIAVHEGLPA